MFGNDEQAVLICNAYRLLFNRLPDTDGANYWRQDLQARKVPTACWTREISFGTRLDDCERHKLIHGYYPRSALCTQSGLRGDANVSDNTACCATIAGSDASGGQICATYRALFNRLPDEGGARYWIEDLKARQVPLMCWSRQISGGTRDGDCETHRLLFGFYPRSPHCPSPQGDAPPTNAASCQ